MSPPSRRLHVSYGRARRSRLDGGIADGRGTSIAALEPRRTALVLPVDFGCKAGGAAGNSDLSMTRTRVRGG